MNGQLYDTICNIIANLNNLLWGFETVLLVFGAGIFFTVRIKCFNVIHIVHAFKSTIFKKGTTRKFSSKGSLSQFQALSTALAASMGTGNIIGVAAAISIGGAGAIFWMWVSAILGSSLAFVENVLGVKYKKHGGGPMAYISKGLGSPALAAVYAAACALASFGIGNMTQTNAMSSAAAELGVSPFFSGAIIALLCGAIIFRGSKKVASAAEKLIPFVSVLYVAAAVTVIAVYGRNISEMLMHIFLSAFGISQISGGICGAVLKKSISTGLRRGIFSNEAGMGSSVLVHTETECDEPAVMGMWAVVEVVIDTLLCCTLTAFVILLTGADRSGADGIGMVTEAFRSVSGSFAPYFTTAVTVIFAFCTLLGWYFYGEKCVTYIYRNGRGRTPKRAVFFYRAAYTLAAFIGAVLQLSLVWELADLFNWFMLMINLFALIVLNREAADYTKDYTKRIKQTK
ncbi:MAG: sodium:alanine symporter family protein [Oscillospiraceae bacterium]|nr:sodium:alanine symporter family protein [Oscillospiraceae bacterium]